MRLRHVVAGVVFAIVALVIATTWTAAQIVAIEPVTPTVMSGSDVGFRVEGIRGGTPVGRLVVKVNGQWVEADLAGRLPTPLRQR